MTMIYLLTCAALFMAVFCRLVMTGPDTLLAVRLSFIGLGVAALLGMYWGLFLAYVPDLPDLALALAITAVQWVAAARLWRGQVPDGYLSPDAATGDSALH